MISQNHSAEYASFLLITLNQLSEEDYSKFKLELSKPDTTLQDLISLNFKLIEKDKMPLLFSNRLDDEWEFIQKDLAEYKIQKTISESEIAQNETNLEDQENYNLRNEGIDNENSNNPENINKSTKFKEKTQKDENLNEKESPNSINKFKKIHNIKDPKEIELKEKHKNKKIKANPEDEKTQEEKLKEEKKIKEKNEKKNKEKLEKEKIKKEKEAEKQKNKQQIETEVIYNYGNKKRKNEVIEFDYTNKYLTNTKENKKPENTDANNKLNEEKNENKENTNQKGKVKTNNTEEQKTDSENKTNKNQELSNEEIKNQEIEAEQKSQEELNQQNIEIEETKIQEQLNQEKLIQEKSEQQIKTEIDLAEKETQSNTETIQENDKNIEGNTEIENSNLIINQQTISDLYRGKLKHLPRFEMKKIIKKSLEQENIKDTLKEIDNLFQNISEANSASLFLLMQMLYQAPELIDIETLTKNFAKFIGNYIAKSIKLEMKCPIKLQALYIENSENLFTKLLTSLPDKLEEINKFEFKVEEISRYLQRTKVEIEFTTHTSKKTHTTKIETTLATKDYMEFLKK